MLPTQRNKTFVLFSFYNVDTLQPSLPHTTWNRCWYHDAKH